MDTQTNGSNGTNGQANIPCEAPKRAIETLEGLLATSKNDKEKKEILGRVGQGIVRRINEAQRRLAACVLNGDLELARQLNREIDEMNALGWHIVKHPVAISGLAEKLLAEITQAFKTGKVQVGGVEIGVQAESPSSRHGVSFL